MIAISSLRSILMLLLTCMASAVLVSCEVKVKYSPAAVSKGEIQRRQGKYLAALKTYSMALSKDSTSIEDLVGRSVVYLDLGMLDSAIIDLETAARHDPDNSLVRYNRAYIAFRLEDFESAVRELDQAIANDSGYAMSYYLRAASKFGLGELDAAIEDYDRAIELDPSFPHSWRERGVVYARLGDSAQALADYNRCVEVDPEFYLGYLERGDYHAKTGCTWLAFADYARAIEIDSTAIMAYVNRSTVHIYLLQFDQAIKDLVRARELAPDFHITQVSLAKCYEEVSDTAAAIDTYRDLLDWAGDRRNDILDTSRARMDRLVAAFGSKR